MSFEDEKLEEAMKCLKHTEEQCQTSTHVFKSIKRKLKHKRRTQVCKGIVAPGFMQLVYFFDSAFKKIPKILLLINTQNDEKESLVC